MREKEKMAKRRVRSDEEMEKKVRIQSNFSAWDKDGKNIIDKGKIVEEREKKSFIACYCKGRRMPIQEIPFACRTTRIAFVDSFC